MITISVRIEPTPSDPGAALGFLVICQAGSTTRASTKLLARLVLSLQMLLAG